MQAIRIHEHGAIDKLKIDQLSIPVPTKSEVLIKVQAAALNHLDVWVRKGIPGVPLPLIMGSDAAGIVETLGPEIPEHSGIKPGDHVIIAPIRSCGSCDFCMAGQENLCRDFHIPGESAQGVQTEFICVPHRYLIKKPVELNFRQAAALPLAAMTAYHMLGVKAEIKSGDTVLVYGASSGVGSIGIQIAKARGAKVITTVATQEKAELAQKLGADYIINYREQQIGQTVKELTSGHGVDIVFEHTGSKTWNESMRALKRNGTLVTCGATTGPFVKIDIRALFIKHQRLIGSTMGTLQDLKEVLQLVEAGKLEPVLDKVFSFQEVHQAHERLEQGAQFGKIVLDF